MKDVGSKGDGENDGGESMSGEGTESSDSDLPELSNRQKKMLSNAESKEEIYGG